MQITYVTAWYPNPADNGARKRALGWIQALATEHTVDLVVAVPDTSCQLEPGPLTTLCRSIVTFPIPAFQPARFRSRLALLRLVPRSYVETYEPEITRHLEQQIQAHACDAILCGELTAYYGWNLANLVPVVVDELDPSRYVEAMDQPALRHRLRTGLTWWKYRRFIRALLAHGAGATTASGKDAGLLRRLTARPDHVVVIPNGITVPDRSRDATREPRRLVYSGAPTYAPNLEAVTFFAGEILPRVRAHVPDAWLAITGATAGATIGDLTRTPGIVFTGWLADIQSYVATSRVCVVPLLHGGGTRLKILEAMALGTPVVATRKGAEGLYLTDGEDILIADTAEEFADATVRLMCDDDFHARIAGRARETVAARYNWDRIAREIRATIVRLTDGAILHGGYPVSRRESRAIHHGPLGARHTGEG
jgi:glycosyltransferase involved in cell wall biosynthesis